MKKTAYVLLISLASAVSAMAEVKVGVVDLNKIFEAYYKTAEAKARVGEVEAAYKKERQLKMEDYQKLADEVNKLRDDAQNPALSPDVQQQKKSAFGEKVKEIQMREGEIRQFDTQRQREIQSTMMRMRNNIVEEIANTVKEHASKSNYTVVLDKTGQSMAGAAMVVYAAESLDFSEDIIKKLNATRPAGGTPAVDTKAPAAK